MQSYENHVVGRCERQESCNTVQTPLCFKYLAIASTMEKLFLRTAEALIHNIWKNEND